MNENGGIKDDCVVTKVNPQHYYVVFNAGNKEKIFAHMKKMAIETKRKFPDVNIEHISTHVRSLVAVQGPKAMHLLQKVLDSNPNLTNLGFMESTNDLKFLKEDVTVTRCGYTGEDGFEVSVSNGNAEALMDKLLSVKDGDKPVAVAAGLGARDSLRLEAGLCLYGHELREDIGPIGAMLAWTISKRRKAELGFLGAEHVKKAIDEGVNSKRCGFIGDKVPIREGTELFASENGKPGKKVGDVCSGTVGPTIGKAVGMAYVDTPFNKVKTELIAVVRGKDYKVTVAKMPFVPSNYYKKP
jgi:aminomethyltransferase